MPSQLHEALLLLFRNRPALAPELLRDALRVTLPHYTEVRLDSADLNHRGRKRCAVGWEVH